MEPLICERGTLILICGVPCAGKSTLAKQLERERRAMRFCPDEWIENILEDHTDIEERDKLRDPVENLHLEWAHIYLKMGLTVILENGFYSSEERYLYALSALELESQIELHVLTPPLDELLQRLQTRNESLESPLWKLPEQDILDAWRVFEDPCPEEMAFYDTAIRY